MVSLDPRSNHRPVVTEQRDTSLALAPLDLNSKHDLIYLSGASAARYLPLSR